MVFFWLRYCLIQTMKNVFGILLILIFGLLVLGFYILEKSGSLNKLKAKELKG